MQQILQFFFAHIVELHLLEPIIIIIIIIIRITFIRTYYYY